LITNSILFGFDITKVMNSIESINNRRTDEKGVCLNNAVFDTDGNLWISWYEYDKKPKDWRTNVEGFVSYIYWYFQKFNSTGIPSSPAIEMEKRKPYADGCFTGYSLFPGSKGGCYFFKEGGFLGRIDKDMNVHVTDRVINPYSLSSHFVDKNKILYILSAVRSLIVCTKVSMQEPMPVFVEEQILPGWDKPEGNKYHWVGSNLYYCDAFKNHAIFLRPPVFSSSSWIDTTKIDVYRVSLPDLNSIDTSSFRVSDALFKEITGCKLRSKELTSKGLLDRWLNVSTLVEGEGDTLILYLSSRNTDEELIYVCKLTKEGKPIKTAKIIEEEVRDFSESPEYMHKQILFFGGIIGKTREPNGIIIYGFDKYSNGYYYAWDKSDAYWKIK